MTACGPVCVVNLGELTLRTSGKGHVKNPVQEAKMLRAMGTDSGSSLDQTTSMINDFFQRNIPEAHLNIRAIQLALPSIEQQRSAELVEGIGIENLISPQNVMPGKHFDIVQVIGIDRGVARISHAILIVGRYAKTGNLIVKDPGSTRTGLFGYSKINLNGQPTLALKYIGKVD